MEKITKLFIQWKITITEPPLKNQKLLNYSNHLTDVLRFLFYTNIISYHYIILISILSINI